MPSHIALSPQPRGALRPRESLKRHTLYVAVTYHGFGHVSRTAAVLARLCELMPDVTPVFVTTAPRWLLKAFFPYHFVHRRQPLDVGAVQRKRFDVDKPATLQALRKTERGRRSLIAREALFIRDAGIPLVLADIPPVATEIAKAAAVPCWMISNFGWDFIYRSWGSEFLATADQAASCYSRCDRLFRLPFHEPMQAFPTVQDVGLIGPIPRYSRRELATALSLPSDRTRNILLTFGALAGHRIPYRNVLRFPEYDFFTLDPTAPAHPNLHRITGPKYRPVDIMPLCSRIICRPGYTTFAEACRVRVPTVTTTRPDFPESRFLLEGLRNYNHYQILEPAAVLDSRWTFLRQPMAEPREKRTLRTDGNDVVAREIMRFLLTATPSV